MPSVCRECPNSGRCLGQSNVACWLASCMVCIAPPSRAGVARQFECQVGAEEHLVRASRASCCMQRLERQPFLKFLRRFCLALGGILPDGNTLSSDAAAAVAALLAVLSHAGCTMRMCIERANMAALYHHFPGAKHQSLAGGEPAVPPCSCNVRPHGALKQCICA